MRNETTLSPTFQKKRPLFFPLRIPKPLFVHYIPLAAHAANLSEVLYWVNGNQKLRLSARKPVFDEYRFRERAMNRAVFMTEWLRWGT